MYPVVFYFPFSNENFTFDVVLFLVFIFLNFPNGIHVLGLSLMSGYERDEGSGFIFPLLPGHERSNVLELIFPFLSGREEGNGLVA